MVVRAASVRPAAGEVAAMTAAARNWVRKHSPARGAGLQVLRELAFAAIDDEGHGALRRQEQLVRDTGLSRRTVQRTLAELERLDLIRRHKGDRSHCQQCRRARRGMVVYDVVIPVAIEDLRPGQETLPIGAMTGANVTLVANDDRRHHDAGTGVTMALLNDSTTRSTANNPSLKGSPSNSNAPSDRPLFDFRTAGTDRAGARVGAGRSRGRRGSRSSSDFAVPVPVAPSPCTLLELDGSQLDSLFDLWDPIAAMLREAVPESTWEIWLASLHPHGVNGAHGERLVLGTPEETVMWVSSRFSRVLRRIATAGAGRPLTVDVTPCLGAPVLDRRGVAA